MEARLDHRWDLTPTEAVELQRELADRVETVDRLAGPPRLVAGADISLDARAGLGFAGVVVFELPRLAEVERVSAVGALSFPYVPGLLSFREGPLLLAAFARLRSLPDVLMFDGQGIAHPRRLGLAAHLGLLLDAPSVGVAKSRLCGAHREPGRRKGSRAALRDSGETIGAVLRTRDGVKPVFVSAGHRVSLDTAVRLTLACTDGYRIPKPTRIADRFVGELRRAGR
jgi:deoxyribonuclease V